MSNRKITQRDDGIVEISPAANKANPIAISLDDATMSPTNVDKKTYNGDQMADIEKRFNEKITELKRYIVGTGLGIAGLLLAGLGLIITVQQIYGTGQDRVADARFDTLVTRLGTAEEYFKATGERQELFKQAVNSSVKKIENDVNNNRQLITTVIEQQQRTNATLDKIAAKNQ